MPEHLNECTKADGSSFAYYLNECCTRDYYDAFGKVFKFGVKVCILMNAPKGGNERCQNLET